MKVGARIGVGCGIANAPVRKCRIDASALGELVAVDEVDEIDGVV